MSTGRFVSSKIISDLPDDPEKVIECIEATFRILKMDPDTVVEKLEKKYKGITKIWKKRVPFLPNELLEKIFETDDAKDLAKRSRVSRDTHQFLGPAMEKLKKEHCIRPLTFKEIMDYLTSVEGQRQGRDDIFISKTEGEISKIRRYVYLYGAHKFYAFDIHSKVPSEPTLKTMKKLYDSGALILEPQFIMEVAAMARQDCYKDFIRHQFIIPGEKILSQKITADGVAELARIYAGKEISVAYEPTKKQSEHIRSRSRKEYPVFYDYVNNRNEEELGVSLNNIWFVLTDSYAGN